METSAVPGSAAAWLSLGMGEEALPLAPAGPEVEVSLVSGGHSRSFPPSSRRHPGLAYTMAVTCDHRKS